MNMPDYINTRSERVVRIYDGHYEYAPGFYFLDEADQLDGIYATELCAAIARDKYFAALRKQDPGLCAKCGMDQDACILPKKDGNPVLSSCHMPKQAGSQAALQAAAHRAADRVQWIINDSAELGVLVDGVAYFLYKGNSLIYVEALHDDGKQMRYRPVGKREFGECCHPIAMDKLTAQQYLAGPGFTAEGWEDLPAFNGLPSTTTVLPAKAFDEVVKILESPSQPTPALMAAAKAYRDMVASGKLVSKPEEEPGVQSFNKSHTLNQIFELKAELAAARAESDRLRHDLAVMKERAEKTKERDRKEALSDSIVGACCCDTKTDVPERHHKGCKYRLIAERDAARSDADAQAAEFRRVNAALIEEQKAYAKLEEQLKRLREAKDENDERFMRERDEARDAAVDLREKLSDMIIFKGQALACSTAVKDAYANVIQETERRCRLIFEKHEQHLREELAEERNHREKSDSIAREAAKQRDQAINRAEQAEKFEAVCHCGTLVRQHTAGDGHDPVEMRQPCEFEMELEACYKAVGWTPGKDQCLSEYLKEWVKQSHADEEIAQLREKVRTLEEGVAMRERLMAAGAKTRDALEAEIRELRSRRPVRE